MKEYYIIFFLTFFLSPNQFIPNLKQKHILNVLGHGGSCAGFSIVKEAGVIFIWIAFLCFHCLDWQQWILIFTPLYIEGGVIIWFYIFTRLVLQRHNIFFVFWNHSSKCTKQNVGEKKGPKSSICFSSYSYKTWKNYFLLLTIQLKWVCPTYTFDTYFFNNWKSSTTASMSKNVENMLLCKVSDE